MAEGMEAAAISRSLGRSRRCGALVSRLRQLRMYSNFAERGPFSLARAGVLTGGLSYAYFDNSTG